MRDNYIIRQQTTESQPERHISACLKRHLIKHQAKKHRCRMADGQNVADYAYACDMRQQASMDVCTNQQNTTDELIDTNGQSSPSHLTSEDVAIL